MRKAKRRACAISSRTSRLRRNALEQQLEEQSQRQRQSSVLWEQAKAQRLSMGRMTCPSNRIGFSKA